MTRKKPLKPYQLSSQNMISSLKNDTMRTASAMLTSTSKYSRRTSSPPTSGKVSYCRICLKKLRIQMQCPFLNAFADLLQERGNKFKKFGKAIRSSQLYYCRRIKMFRIGKGLQLYRDSSDEVNTVHAAHKQLITAVNIYMKYPSTTF